MEAIVLAGGLGSRLRPVVPDLPKPMALVAGRPFLEILLTLLVERGFAHVVLSLGYMAQHVSDHFGDQFASMRLTYEVEDTPLGTGGAVRRALRRCESKHVYVLNGDTYLDLEFSEVECHWQQVQGPIIVAREVPDTARFGRLDTADGRVLGFSQKGVAGPGLINAGCYVFPRDIACGFPRAEAFSLETDVLAKLVTQRPLHCFVSRGKFIDIGVPEDYARAQSELAELCR